MISDQEEARKNVVAVLTGGHFTTKPVELLQTRFVDFGRVRTHHNQVVEVIGLSAERRFLQRLTNLGDSLMGYVLLLSGEVPRERLGYFGYLMNSLAQTVAAPCAVAVLRSEEASVPGAETVREALRLGRKTPVVEVDANRPPTMARLLNELVAQGAEVEAGVREIGEEEDEARSYPAELRSENLVKIYGKRRVVNGVSIDVKQGEIVGLLGPNGAGKTTTFHMITGLVRPNAGKIYLNDRDITRQPMYRRARMGIGYLSQEPSVFRRLTVEQNIMAILETLPLSKQARRERLEALLAELNISHLAKNKAYTLSGGERRRVEITRALVTNPKFILLDEPFAGVDPIAVEEIQNIVQSLKYRGIGVLVTDHNVHETLSITDRAYLMYDGVVLKSGTAEFLANDPEALKLYLGERFRLVR